MTNPTMSNVIKIGPEFFANAVRDYTNKYWAFVREILQNAMDSDGCNFIDIKVENDGTGVVVTVTDNGTGMSREIITEKLLALGGSGKSCENGKVGGFGKAKEILYFAQRQYQIDTQTYRVIGAGANYDLTTIPYVKGCIAKVWMNGYDEAELLNMFKRFLDMSQWSGKVFLNGSLRPTNLRKGSYRRSFSFAHIYSNKTYNGIMIVRMRGIPMFYQHIDKSTIIVELVGTSYNVLTANRDSLRYEHGCQLSQFVRDLYTNKTKALSNRTTKITRYAGPSISVTADLRQQMAMVAAAATSVVAGEVAAAADEENGPMIPAAELVGGVRQQSGGMTSTATTSTPTGFNFKFAIKNTTGLETPDYYKPGSTFSSYSKKLVSWWVNCLTEIHKALNVSGDFGVGFILDEDAEAEFERKDGDITYYINPALVVKQTASNSRSLKKRFDLTADQMRVLAIAVHEYTHRSHDSHDEDYANSLTDNMAKIMAALNTFKPCFRTPLFN